MLYLKIRQLHERKFKIAQIADELKISRPTVYKYLEMTFEEAQEYLGNPHRKPKKLDPYRDWIVAWLEEYPHLSAAQIQDWLLERYPDLNIGESTVRLYVSEVREIYQIEKKTIVRQYEAVSEQPMGKQLQVDWGETKQKTTMKKEVKLYFIAFVLAHSRYKYMEWQDRPFTTKDAIRCHENAFHFYGGRPEEIVYDQDHLLTVSENAGDLLLTSDFQTYVRERKFKVHLCRKADPESKGMIENVVKYIKGNFADSRVFSDSEDWNERALHWLERTGNKNVHQTTKKRPVEVFLVEKQHLQPVSPLLSNESTHAHSIARNVGKDNTIRFKSNRYSVPLGTYGSQAENQVFIEIKDGKRGTLIIRKQANGEIIAEHQISAEKGKLIKNRNHSRDRSKGIEEFKQRVISSFEEQEAAMTYVDEICLKYTRYRRDQLAILETVIKNNPEWINQTLQKCLIEKLYSANDFRDVVSHFKKVNTESESLPIIKESSNVRLAKIKIDVTTRSLSAYTRILGGRAQ
ncbi:IS21 family transposase [Paenisporosarcina sp. OV554]|uniref:IS21 family transposase n=1 Tax=Paenisporosarcina sp. OV554 TaxID=2135694 RepID=UPI000D33AF7B|nr:IS21 family transposase [Paenisporosarcina sp. OV554]PUB01651.1 transposase [Paenisporosarcina sp. OV554]